jgi:hydroxymethylpyrimidine pyrophosphatase-like HAD family hydrolase
MSTPLRLLFLDLDGTLVGKDDRVSARTVAALNRAVEAGCIPVICTARNRYMVEHVAAQWRGHGYAILSNGAVIANWETGEVLQKIPIPRTAVQQAARIAHTSKACPLCFGVHVEDDGGKTIYTDRHFLPPAAYLARQGHRLAFVDNLEGDHPLSPVGMGAYGPRDQIEPLAQAWRQELGSEIAVFDSRELKYDCWCAFLNLKAADKAFAARRVAEMLGISQEQTLAVGDHLNDVSLLQWAGMGVCMGDGHEDAKAVADFVTGTLAEDGAAQAIERFVPGM